MAKADPTKSITQPRFTKRCIDVTGRSFGRLLVVSWGGRNSRGETLWNCTCECGKSVAVAVSRLKGGTIKSCGCLIRDTTRTRATTHGMANSPEYRTWSHMIDRCENSRDKDFANYGGRGIRICTRWRESFEAFHSDMGSRPSAGHSIDRIDCNGDYCPENCRWATASEQALNRRHRKLTLNGESLTVSQWSAKLGISRATLKWRIRQGLAVELILSQKCLRHGSNRSLPAQVL